MSTIRKKGWIKSSEGKERFYGGCYVFIVALFFGILIATFIFFRLILHFEDQMLVVPKWIGVPAYLFSIIFVVTALNNLFRRFFIVFIVGALAFFIIPIVFWFL